MTANQLFLAVLALPVVALADTVPVSQEAAHQDVAKAYFTALHGDEVLDVFVAEVSKTYAERIARDGGKPTPGIVAAIQQMTAADFACLHDWKRNHYVSAYAKAYTSEDMLQLIEWSHTPLGQRFIAAEVPIYKELVEDSQKLDHDAYVSAWSHHKGDYAKLGLVFGGAKK